MSPEEEFLRYLNASHEASALTAEQRQQVLHFFREALDMMPEGENPSVTIKMMGMACQFCHQDLAAFPVMESSDGRRRVIDAAPEKIVGLCVEWTFHVVNFHTRGLNPAAEKILAEAILEDLRKEGGLN